MTDDGEDQVDDPSGRLFGDPRSAYVQRGPERRAADEAGYVRPPELGAQALPARHLNSGYALRSGRGDGFATVLMIAGILVLGGTIVAGVLILYNAKNVGAFSNPWDSTRVAIGVAVLAVGLVQSVILIGLSRVTSYLLAIMRLRTREHDLGQQRDPL